MCVCPPTHEYFRQTEREREGDAEVKVGRGRERGIGRGVGSRERERDGVGYCVHSHFTRLPSCKVNVRYHKARSTLLPYTRPANLTSSIILPPLAFYPLPPCLLPLPPAYLPLPPTYLPLLPAYLPLPPAYLPCILHLRRCRAWYVYLIYASRAPPPCIMHMDIPAFVVRRV